MTDVGSWLMERLSAAGGDDRAPESISPDEHLSHDLAIDSLAFIELMVDFEEAFGVRFAEADLLPGSYDTVHDLLSRLHSALDHEDTLSEVIDARIDD